MLIAFHTNTPRLISHETHPDSPDIWRFQYEPGPQEVVPVGAVRRAVASYETIHYVRVGKYAHPVMVVYCYDHRLLRYFADEAVRDTAVKTFCTQWADKLRESAAYASIGSRPRI